MTKRSYLWENDKTDGAPITEAQWQLLMRILSGNLDTTKAIVANLRSGFWPVTTPGADQLTVPAGVAFPGGAIFDSDASETVDVLPRPSTGTTGKLLVLRRDAVAGTVTFAIVASADGTATIPSITNLDLDDKYDWAIASFTHATTGTIASITDARSKFVLGGGMKKSANGGQYVLPTAISAGVAITAGTGSFGSAGTLEASASEDKKVLGVHLNCGGGTINYVRGRILADGVVRGTFHSTRWLNTSGQDGPGYVPLDRPAQILSGEAITVDLADNAGGSWSVSLTVIDDADEEDY